MNVQIRRRALGLLLAGLPFLPDPSLAQTPNSSILLPRSMAPAGQTEFKTVADLPGTVEVKSQPDQGVLIKSADGGQPISMLAVATREFRALTGRISGFFDWEPKTRPSFMQLLNRKLQPLAIPAIEIEQPSAIWSQLASGPITGPRVELDRSEKLAAAILSAQRAGLPITVSDVVALPDRKTPKGVTAAFTARFNDTLDKLANAILDPTQVRRQIFTATVKPTRDALIELWPTIRPKQFSEERREVGRRWGLLSAQSSLKAIYGGTSDFQPSTYRQMFEQSRRVVGIGPDIPNCSGMLVSAEWVMTAGHCLKSGIQDMLVTVDIDVEMVKDASGTSHARRLDPDQMTGQQIAQLRRRIRVDDAWPAEGTGQSDQDGIDYAFLHLKQDEMDEKLVGFLGQIETVAALHFCQSTPAKGVPVAVIARRMRDAAKVYDYARVLFPFRASPAQFKELTVDTGLGIQRFVDETFDEPAQRAEEFDSRMTEFEQAYVKNPDGYYEYRAQRIDLAGRRPFFGMDTDTVHGNSGGPVFSREQPCIIGIFTGGQLDGAKFQSGSWSRHEFGTPLREVVADLRQQNPAQDASPEQIAQRNRLMMLMNGFMQPAPPGSQ